MAAPNKSRAWTFTLFPGIVAEEKILLEWVKEIEKIDCTWLIMQTERTPGTEKLHVQGAIYFPTARTMRGVTRKFPGHPHLEVMIRACAVSKEYCSKSLSKASGTMEYFFETGSMPTQGIRTDITAILEFAKTHTVAQCWDEFPTTMFRYNRAVKTFKEDMRPKQSGRPSVTVYWGPTGTGKSYACLMNASNGENGLIGDREYFSMLTPYSAKSVPWIDGYNGEEDVVIEDFSGEINYRIFLRMLDQYPNKMQVKGGVTEFAPKRIWISSNKHPRDWYPTETYVRGPLERRMETDETGHIYEKVTVWEAGQVVAMVDIEVLD